MDDRGNLSEVLDGDSAQASAERTRAGSPPIVEHFLNRMAHADHSPKVLVDGDCNILWQSPEATQLLRPPMPLMIKGNRLQSNLPGSSRRWTDFIDNLGENGDRLFLTADGASTWVLAQGWAEERDRERVIFLKFAMSWPFRDVVSSGLAADFGLTRSEAAVLDQFASLKKPAQIAEQLQISVSTVRSHLKQIHAKMGVNSGVQLLRITRAHCDFL